MCPIVPTFTCGLLRSNFSFAMSNQLLARFDSRAALQKPFPAAGLSATYILLGRDHDPGLERAGPPSGFRIVLVEASVHVLSNPDVMLPSRNTLKHVQKPLQKLEPLTGIEPVTSSLPRTRSTI